MKTYYLKGTKDRPDNYAKVTEGKSSGKLNIIVKDLTSSLWIVQNKLFNLTIENEKLAFRNLLKKYSESSKEEFDELRRQLLSQHKPQMTQSKQDWPISTEELFEKIKELKKKNTGEI